MICAWCPVQPGATAPGAALASHGICDDCRDKFIFDVMKRPMQPLPRHRCSECGQEFADAKSALLCCMNVPARPDADADDDENDGKKTVDFHD